MPTVDVRTRGWNNEACTSRTWQDDSYEDDEGYQHSDGQWVDKLKCNCQAIDAKHDYCRTCGLILEYP